MKNKIQKISRQDAKAQSNFFLASLAALRESLNGK
jgi:hypothetical protein